VETDRGGSHRIRVVVADDHPVYRQGIIDVIKRRPDLELVGEAGDGREALELITRESPEVALLDMRMPHLDGLRVLNAVRRDGSETKVIFLSAQYTSESVYAALGAGASGFLSKEAGPREVAEAIASVFRGSTVLGPQIQEVLAEEVRRRSSTDRPVLTKREAEVLKFIAQGKSAPDIAAELHLSPTTVKTHLASLYDKLGVNERAAAVAEAMRAGLLE
jgi:two-component system, NarL family, nitrate/nitrite response regulator NarL